MSRKQTLAHAGVAFGFALAVAGAQAATVDWRQGSGNTGQNFTTGSGAVVFTSGSGDLTVGLRAVQRGVGTITPTAGEYAVNAGPSSAVNRAWWNFDIYAGLTNTNGTATLAGLSELTMVITSIGGAAPGAASFNLLGTLRSSIDCHVIGCVNGNPVNPDATVGDVISGANDGPGGPVANAARYYNASQNAVFAPWFSGFDMNQLATYDFTLIARDSQNNVVSSMMRVNVGGHVPEPGSLALGGLALVGAFAVSRRKKA